MEERNFAAYVPQVRFELIPIKNLVSNQDYQRNLSRAHIARAAEHFDTFQINPVKVSRRDGKNYVINGQHTIEIVAYISGSRDTPVWCMIYDELNYMHEADIFANQQKYVKKLTAYEIFMANIEAGSDEQIMIKDIVETYGLTIGSQRGHCVICAVSTLEWIYEHHGCEVLRRVLRLCIGTWEGDMNSFSASVLRGICKLVVAYEEKLNEEIFKEKVGLVSIKQIIRTAKERGGGTMGYAETMLIAYNGKRKGDRLSRKFLYLSKKPKEGIYGTDAVEYDEYSYDYEDNAVDEETYDRENDTEDDSNPSDNADETKVAV